MYNVFLGKRILIVCAGYFYEGILVGISKSCLKIKDAAIVYSTGAWSDKNYSDIQKLNSSNWYVKKNLIESFGLSKNDES